MNCSVGFSFENLIKYTNVCLIFKILHDMTLPSLSEFNIRTYNNSHYEK